MIFNQPFRHNYHIYFFENHALLEIDQISCTIILEIILSHIMTTHDKLNKHKIISILISLVGLIMIIGVKKGGYSVGTIGLIGIALLFLNIIFQGFSAIKLSEYKADIDPIFLNAVQMFFWERKIS